MKIFFLSQYCVELYKPIYEELLNQGHEVFLVEDVSLPYDFRPRKFSNFKRLVLKSVRFLLQTEKKYWRKKIKENPVDYNKFYDLFFCIDGTSFHPYLLFHLKKFNPHIKSSLYLWDSNKFYDFFLYNDLYDRVMTFDLDDAEKSTKAEVLPSFWFESPSRPPKYSLSIIGSDHDDRLEIVEKVYHQLVDANLKSALRVVIFQPKEPSDCRRYFSYYKNKYKERCSAYESKKLLPYTTTKPQTMMEVVRIIDESACVLDTDMPIQVGATERVIWALARGKKVLSTNTQLKKMPFYNRDQIHFIDRLNPVLDIEFITSKGEFPINPYIEDLRIDKWVHKMIDF